MKASKSSIGRSVDQPEPKVRFYLFLGPDEAQSRSLAGRLLSALAAQKFLLNQGDLKGSPGLLVDEAAALSLFGERRLVWIEPAGNDIFEAVEALLSVDVIESPVVAIAGALPKSSALLKLAESSPQALAFTAYIPEGEDALRMVADLGRRLGLKIAPPVAALIAEACASDQAIAAQELEKFALYVGASPNSPKDLEQEALDQVGTDSGEGDLNRLADLALLGEIGELGQAVSHMSANGAVPAIRALQRRILMLAPARARLERGERLDRVMASFGRSLFWKDKASVEKMLRRWSAQDLGTVARRAGELERSLMFSEMPEREALGEELLGLARKARSVAR